MPTTATVNTPATTASALSQDAPTHVKCANPAHTAALAQLGHAISDPTRAAILLALRHGSHCPADLAAELAVSRQSMSNHLTCLRDCGLVIAERRGRHAHYQLSQPELAQALDAMLAVTLIVDPDCCEGEGCSC